MKEGWSSKRFFLVFLCIAFGFSLAGCAGPSYKPAGPVNCPANFQWEVAPEAEITLLNCSLKPYAGWKKKSVLHFEIGVKNKSQTAQRFRVQFFLPEDVQAGGGLLPASGKVRHLEPGKEAKGTYPLNLERIPAKVQVIVKTVALE